ncbi:Ecdysteroid kinase domain-containing protein [Trichoderma chlorosporum]
MTRRIEPSQIAAILLSWLDLELISCSTLQGLWAGYGHICSVSARPTAECATTRWQRFSKDQGNGQGSTIQLILKIVHPPTTTGDEGHLRKMFSYEVEQYFYDEVAPRLTGGIAVAQCFASTRSMRQKAIEHGIDHLMVTLMNDLRIEFPVAGEKRAVLSSKQVYASLTWMAKFHSSSWSYLPQNRDEFLLPPLEEASRRQIDPKSGGKTLWLNGGYTYLATRRQEYQSLEQDQSSEWSDILCTSVDGSPSVAEDVASFLTPRGRPFETYIHGDVKSENLYSTESGDDVVFFDFQYAGIGLGVCDLAKLFTCSIPLSMLTNSEDIPEELGINVCERKLLKHYWSILMETRPNSKIPTYDWDEFLRHWETALVDWCRFQASWGFWGNTEWLEARVRFITKDRGWRNWLQGQTSDT